MFGSLHGDIEGLDELGALVSRIKSLSEGRSTNSRPDNQYFGDNVGEKKVKDLTGEELSEVLTSSFYNTLLDVAPYFAEQVAGAIKGMIQSPGGSMGISYAVAVGMKSYFSAIEEMEKVEKDVHNPQNSIWHDKWSDALGDEAERNWATAAVEDGVDHVPDDYEETRRESLIGWALAVKNGKEPTQDDLYAAYPEKVEEDVHHRRNSIWNEKWENAHGVEALRDWATAAVETGVDHVPEDIKGCRAEGIIKWALAVKNGKEPSKDDLYAAYPEKAEGDVHHLLNSIWQKKWPNAMGSEAEREWAMAAVETGVTHVPEDVEGSDAEAFIKWALAVKNGEKPAEEDLAIAFREDSDDFQMNPEYRRLYVEFQMGIDKDDEEEVREWAERAFTAGMEHCPEGCPSCRVERTLEEYREEFQSLSPNYNVEEPAEDLFD